MTPVRGKKMRDNARRAVPLVFSRSSFVNVKHRWFVSTLLIVRTSRKAFCLTCVCARGTLRVALHLPSLNNLCEKSAQGDFIKETQRKRGKKMKRLSDRLRVLMKHPRCANCEKEDVTESQGLLLLTLFCVHNT